MVTLTGFSLPAGRTALKLGLTAALLVVLHVLAMQANFNDDLGIKEKYDLHYWQVSVFDLDEEEGFGTWFSSVNLLFTGGLLLALARARKAAGDYWHVWWRILGIGFVLLSIDEIVALHEYGNSLMEDGQWTDVGFWILGIVGVAYLPFLLRLPRRTALLFFTAGAIYGGGAVGVEHWTDAEVNSLHYNMWTTLEEGMEMAGVIVMIYALLDLMRGSPKQVARVELGTADA